MKFILKNLAPAFLIIFIFFCGASNSSAQSSSQQINVGVGVLSEGYCDNDGICEPLLNETPASCPYDCGSCDTHGDLNKNGSINLTDFSILMYYWGQTNPANPCADINKDGIVNITDFSIMLYYWG